MPNTPGGGDLWVWDVLLSAIEDLLAFQLTASGRSFEREYRFHPKRRWRFDFTLIQGSPIAPEKKIAVEVEGGQWKYGHHQRPQGFADDCEKYNEAAIQGWRVLRFTGGMVESGAALQTIERALRGEE